MNKPLVKDAIGWGFALWLMGYVLGMILFFLVPPAAIGWIIMPIGTIITLWVLLKKVQGNSFTYYVTLSLSWLAIAVTFDYLFIVQMLKPADGYYKPDVYIYYALTFMLPLLAGWRKMTKTKV